MRPHHDPSDHDCRGGVPGDLYPFWPDPSSPTATETQTIAALDCPDCRFEMSGLTFGRIGRLLPPDRSDIIVRLCDAHREQR